MTNFAVLTIFSSSELREDEVCGGRQREPGEGRVGRHRLREETHQVRLPVQRALRSTEKAEAINLTDPLKLSLSIIEELHLINRCLVIVSIAAVMHRLISNAGRHRWSDLIS